jgi:hypothetical protein
MPDTHKKSVIEAPPGKIWLHDLREMLAWYCQNLCSVDLRDPRGHRVLFAPERFPHLIKLRQKDSSKGVNKPKKVVEQIRYGIKSNDDFGGYEAHRAQTLSWLPPIIQRPTAIIEVTRLFKEEKPGDTLYIKQFDKDGYKFKILVCRRVGESVLVPITCHPRTDNRFGEGYKIVWE